MTETIGMELAQAYSHWAILCAREVGPHPPAWERWADDWLSGADRSARAMDVAWAPATMFAWAGMTARSENAELAAAWAARAAWAESADLAADWAAMAAAEAARAADDPIDFAALAREAGIPFTPDKWLDLGLMPELPDGSLLVWKHVSTAGKGNLGYPYAVGQRFSCPGMACAGPAGALRDWQKGVEPCVLAIAADGLFDWPEDGVFLCLSGTPLAIYRVEHDGDELLSQLIEGQDVWRLIVNG